MALITRSIEMSFSASRLRRTATSMSIWSLLIRAVPGLVPAAGIAGAGRVGGVLLRQAAELHLHPARAKLAVAHRALRFADLQRDGPQIRVDHPCFMVNGTTG